MAGSGSTVLSKRVINAAFIECAARCSPLTEDALFVGTQLSLCSAVMQSFSVMNSAALHDARIPTLPGDKSAERINSSHSALRSIEPISAPVRSDESVRDGESNIRVIRKLRAALITDIYSLLRKRDNGSDIESTPNKESVNLVSRKLSTSSSQILANPLWLKKVSFLPRGNRPPTKVQPMSRAFFSPSSVAARVQQNPDGIGAGYGNNTSDAFDYFSP